MVGHVAKLEFALSIPFSNVPVLQLRTDAVRATTLGVHHIVEGHVPSEVRFAEGIVREPGEMFQCFGMLFLIDTGMSQGVDDSVGAVLRITLRDATATFPDGKRTLLWDSTHRQPAGRAAACGK